MLRRACALAVLAAGMGIVAAPASGEEDMRTAAPYAQGLRERGYFDLAEQFLEQLRNDPTAPPELRETVDYELGRIKLDEAARTGDLVLRDQLLAEARGELDAFTRAHPKHKLFTEASVEKARLLVERGHLAMLQSDETEDKKDKAAKLDAARASFDAAREAYGQADEKLTAAFKAFPPYIPDNQSAQKAERDRTHIAMMDAQLQKAVVDYEQGHTYPLGSKERDEYLAKGLTQFEDIYKRYRTQIAGLTARMYQAKCFEEKGEIGSALGIYNELLEHPDPRLRGLQRHVGYFKIIAHTKRQEYPLAADLALGWLQKFNAPAEHRSLQGLGVQLERAKNLLAQLPTVDDKQKPAYIAQATDVLGRVVRVASPFKKEALELLRKYKPKAAPNADNLAKMSYEELIGTADEAISEQSWDKAIAALKFAIKKIDPAKEPDKANLPRYTLSYCYYRNAQPYEADVLAEHLARRHPRFSLAAKATEIGMASLSDAYSAYGFFDRTTDLNRLIDLAKYTIETWPEKDSSDLARTTLGMIYHGTGDYPKAIAVYNSIATKSPKWIEGQTKLGTTHWMYSLELRRKGDEKAADTEVEKSLATLNGALKARRAAGMTDTDPEMISNVCDIADVQLDSGKAPDALAQLDPVVKAQTAQTGAAYARLMTDLLRAHILTNQVEVALKDMEALEKSGSGGNLTQLYFRLGTLLKEEMERLKKKGDSARLSLTQKNYQKFLTALVSAKAGQTYESLEWAGENMLTLGNYKEAGEVFERVLKTYGKDDMFLAKAGGSEKLFRTRVREAAALRGQRDFTAAEDLVVELKKEFPRALEPLIEEGMLLEEKAANADKKASKLEWGKAFTHWQRLALRLQGARPKPAEYYDAWYHGAYALFKQGNGLKAKQTLNSIMRLSPKLSGPEMKTKYDDLLKSIK